MAITFAQSTNNNFGMAASMPVPNVTASGSTFTIPAVTGTMTNYAYNTKTYPQRSWQTSSEFWGQYYIGNTFAGSFNISRSSPLELSEVSGWTSKSWTGSAAAKSLSTSTFFNSATKSSRTLSITIRSAGWSIVAESGAGGSGSGSWTQGSGSATLTLNAPPSFSETFSYVGDYSGVPYAGLTTAKVKLSSLSAQYGGDFSGVGKAEFTIGSQTVSKANPANNDELSIALNAVGTFTPTVKVTDSRGQVTTHTLPAITVMGYTAPSVTYDAERTTSTGAPNDEGTYAVINPKFTFTDAIATLSAPTVAVTDAEGVARTPTVTWYSTRAADGTLSGSVTWSNLSSGDTVYGLVSITNGFNTQKSYQISVTPQDSEDSGTTITQTLGSAFYTVDFLAGGHGIAFGQPASEEGFECNMSALFKDDLLLDLPEYTTAGTTDKAIYDACVALGWDSDVLVN